LEVDTWEDISRRETCSQTDARHLQSGAVKILNVAGWTPHKL